MQGLPGQPFGSTRHQQVLPGSAQLLASGPKGPRQLRRHGGGAGRAGSNRASLSPTLTLCMHSRASPPRGIFRSRAGGTLQCGPLKVRIPEDRK